MAFLACNSDQHSTETTDPENTRPNVILIMADDLGYGDVGCYGATKVITPHIDRIAQGGRRFTDAHASSNVCTPSRYGLVTGRYFWRVPESNRNSLLIDLDQSTIGKIMQSAGYRTACIGKWHLGFTRDNPVNWNGPLVPGPLEVGFDYFYGTPMSHNEAPFVLVENHRVVGLDTADPILITESNKTNVWEGMRGGKAAHFESNRLATRYAQKAVTFIREQKDQPFFLYIPTNNVHGPYTPHERFLGTSEIGDYGDYIHELDWMVGIIDATLEQTGLKENTIIIITSDNGAVEIQQVRDKQHYANGMLIGQKTDVWEGGHRIPFIARWPGQIPAGTVADDLICLTDILATMAELTGQAVPEGQGRDSRNILPALLDKPRNGTGRRTLVIEGQPGLAIRRGEWLLIPHHGSGGLTTFPGDWPFMDMSELRYDNSDYTPDGNLRADAPPGQLYNILQDPAQSTNVYNEHPDIVLELNDLLMSIEEGADLTQRQAEVSRYLMGLQNKLQDLKNAQE